MNDLTALLAERPLPPFDGDKRHRGSLVVVGGADTCPGGGLLAGVAALRAGCGRAQLAVHPSVATAVGAAFPEAFVIGWSPPDPPPAPLADRLSRAAAVLVGPGLFAAGPEAATVVAASVRDDVPVLLDASALPATWEVAATRRVVVAPNPAEAAELLDADDRSDDEDGVAATARALAERLGTPAAVRGVVTVLADEHGQMWCHQSATPGLGTAGSGDVAAGIIGGLLARGADELTALAWGIALHAEAGAIAAVDVGPVGFLAREVADRVPKALLRLQSG